MMGTENSIDKNVQGLRSLSSERCLLSVLYYTVLYEYVIKYHCFLWMPFPSHEHTSLG